MYYSMRHWLYSCIYKHLFIMTLSKTINLKTLRRFQSGTCCYPHKYPTKNTLNSKTLIFGKKSLQRGFKWKFWIWKAKLTLIKIKNIVETWLLWKHIGIHCMGQDSAILGPDVGGITMAIFQFFPSRSQKPPIRLTCLSCNHNFWKKYFF